MTPILLAAALAVAQYGPTTNSPNDLPTVASFLAALPENQGAAAGYLAPKSSLLDRNRQAALSMQYLAAELRRCPAAPPHLSITREGGESADRPSIVVVLMCRPGPERVLTFRFSGSKIVRIDLQDVVYYSPVPPPLPPGRPNP